MRAFLIINSNSGDDTISNEEQGELVKGYLSKAGLEVDLHLTTPESHATDMARQAVNDGVGIIIVGGGDGTVEPVAAELINSEATLGILPMGTFNNMARSLDIPKDLEEACQVIAHGFSRHVDVGQANGERYFFEAAGVGLDAELFPLGEQIKQGDWTGWWHIAKKAWKYRPLPINMIFDRTLLEAAPRGLRRKLNPKSLGKKGVRRLALIAVGANGPFYGGGLAVAPDAKLEDGCLTVTVYRNFSKWELFMHFRSITEGRRMYSAKMESYQVAEVRFESNPPQAVHVDGEPFGTTPLTLKSIPKALRVFCPRPAGQKLESAEEQAVESHEGKLP